MKLIITPILPMLKNELFSIENKKDGTIHLLNVVVLDKIWIKKYSLVCRTLDRVIINFLS